MIPSVTTKNKCGIAKIALFVAVLFFACAAMAEGDTTTTANATKNGPDSQVSKVETGAAASNEETTAKAPQPPAIFYAIAVIMAVGSISAGFAVGKVGAAAMGAAAEKPELLGKAIAFVGLGEGIALFGFLISLFLVFRI